jgi:hypothetical protein
MQVFRHALHNQVADAKLVQVGYAVNLEIEGFREAHHEPAFPGSLFTIASSPQAPHWARLRLAQPALLIGLRPIRMLGSEH